MSTKRSCCQRKTNGGLEKGLANLWSMKKIKKKPPRGSWARNQMGNPRSENPQTIQAVKTKLSFFPTVLALLVGIHQADAQGVALIPVGVFTMGDTLDGEPDANASGNFTITATNAVNLNVPQCFYILQMQ
jgi:hypothetical protein